MKLTVSALLLLLGFGVTLAAVDGDKAAYVGGTMVGVKEKVEGKLTTDDAADLIFTAKQARFSIPYAKVDSIEYGQKAGRRVGVAIAISPVALLSKKRNHFLTVGYKDDAGKEQAAVFELGKDIVRTTLKVLEVRTNHKIEFQDEDAKKQYGGGK
jgi:hypothetical protein